MKEEKMQFMKAMASALAKCKNCPNEGKCVSACEDTIGFEMVMEEKLNYGVMPVVSHINLIGKEGDVR
jgi:hypothetical protein